MEQLRQELKHINLLGSLRGMLHWDQETYLPDQATRFRAEQMSFLGTKIRDLYDSQSFRKVLGKWVDLESGTISEDDLSKKQRRLLQETYRDWNQTTSLSPNLVQQLSEITSKAGQSWQKAREEDDFEVFESDLHRIVNLQRKKAEQLGYEDEPYDALVDDYEPRMTAERLETIFEPVKTELTEIADRIRVTKETEELPSLTGEYPVETQSKMSRRILEAMGYDFSRGRIDEAFHPFTTGLHPSDTRITLRFQKDDLAAGLSTALHEGGHALYEQGLDADAFGTPLGESLSPAMHEAQSRLWENMVGGSKAFWNHWFPRLKSEFPDNLAGVEMEDWYRKFNEIKPSLIRVEADEIHYHLHILVRFELERQLINGEIQVSRLPDLWNDRTEHYLDMRPENLAEGVLQDKHWSWGYFGYFPTYSLGTFYATQIYQAAEEQIQNLEKKIAGGNLKPLSEWLTNNIYRKGRLNTVHQTINDLSGEDPSAVPFLEYIQQKYGELYYL